MSFGATAVRVMIASPSDVPSARDSVERALHDWNQANAHNRDIVLMPWRWESSSVPMMGRPAQSTINAQGLDQADIVFVLFGTKIGPETETALSGTVEELVRASEQGKPVHVYFSQEPVDPASINTEQLDLLRTYKASLEGLYSEFTNESELVVHVWRAVEHDLGLLDLGAASPGGSTVEDVAWSLDHERERELKGYSKQGKSQYTTRHELVVTNRGKSTATGVTFAAAPEGSSMHLNVGSNPTDIYSGQSCRKASGRPVRSRFRPRVASVWAHAASLLAAVGSGDETTMKWSSQDLSLGRSAGRRAESRRTEGCSTCPDV